MDKRTVVGRFIHAAWYNLNHRCGGNGLYYKPTIKNKSYAHVFIRFTREEFKAWCWGNKNIIQALEHPSVDRLDSDADYYFSNMRVIEWRDNVKRSKLTEAGGMCRKCKVVLPLDSFTTTNLNRLKKTAICKPCRNVKKKEYYQMAKARQGS